MLFGTWCEWFLEPCLILKLFVWRRKYEQAASSLETAAQFHLEQKVPITALFIQGQDSQQQDEDQNKLHNQRLRHNHTGMCDISVIF